MMLNLIHSVDNEESSCVPSEQCILKMILFIWVCHREVRISKFFYFYQVKWREEVNVE